MVRFVRCGVVNAKPLVVVASQRNMKYYSVSEAAQICGVTPGTIRRWVQTGKLDDYHASSQSDIMSQSHTIRISKDALEAYCDENGIVMKSGRDRR